VIVIDASVAFKLFIPEAGSAEALRLLPYCAAFMAPDIFQLEMAAAAAKYWRRRVITLDEARLIEATARRIVADLRPWQPLLVPAFELAMLLRHGVYDCLYLALAQQLSLPLVTADIKLESKVRQVGLATRVYTLAEVDRLLGDLGAAS
jgi:predicted nucleic acid-binding protein